MRGVWKKTLVSLGLTDEDEEIYDDHMEAEPVPSREEPSVRTLRGEGRREGRHPAGRNVVRSIPTQAPRQVHVVEPRILDDAQDLADRFKGGVPVIVNLRTAEPNHVPKILQFASGLVYGLNGRMQKVGEHVFLLTPFNMEVSADEKRRLAEHGLFQDL
ncbi:MAG TPA: cell division protein SepF [Actinomycetota bacterium]